MNRILLITPLILLFMICVFVLMYLLSSKDPNKPPSALLDKDIPLFKSKSLFDNDQYLITKDLKNKKVLINFFASWCTPCKVEHPLFFELSNDNSELYIVGFNHKDAELDAKNYLEEDGNPYNFVGIDNDGLIALEFGVFGLPETFLINENGKIIYKHMGPLTKEIIKNDIEPLL